MQKLAHLAIAMVLATISTATLAADKGKVELAYVEWSTEIASTNVERQR